MSVPTKNQGHMIVKVFVEFEGEKNYSKSSFHLQLMFISFCRPVLLLDFVRRSGKKIPKMLILK